jgi:hypothetical protein
MTSRERVLAALNHQEPDRVPVDLGSTPVSGIHASTLSQLRLALGLDKPGDRVKVVEPYQMLGEVGEDLREALGIDTVGLGGRVTMFGYPAADWKEWELFDGTPVLVPGLFNTGREKNGDLLQYPEGDKKAPASGRMPAGGYYHDVIVRQEPIEEARLNPEDNVEEFRHLTHEDAAYWEAEAERLYRGTDYAVVGAWGGAGFGDIAWIPGPGLKHPRGIRDIAEWYMSTVSRRDYVYEVFERHCEIALQNLARVAPLVGERVQVLFTSGTDFGTQRGPFLSVETYRDLFKPFHTLINTWVHHNTAWKTFTHTCGGVRPLLEEMIEAGFDILNPVQVSAEGMEAAGLKRDFGDRLVFWGGGADTQKTLPFGTPEEVKREVRERLEIFAPGGGFVFNAIHNLQPRTPVENVLAMFEAVREWGK